MRLSAGFTLLSSLVLAACVHKGPNPDDPYESINRKVYGFNSALDKVILKPTAQVYTAVLPALVRKSVSNAYNNVLMIPTVGNDLLQAEWKYAIKDTWRFFVNSTFGIGGLFDVASTSFSLPPHYNDMGLTFAKWGDKKSPYIVIPFLGPSTIRDGMSLPFNYVMSPYPFVHYDSIFYPLMGVRYIDLRSQLLETDKLMNEALDKYSFMRDAYLQHRNYLITGETVDNSNSMYIDDEEITDYVDDEEPIKEKANNQPENKKESDAAHSASPAPDPTKHG
ncbi:MAG: VacJ family lipoprotein [Proteobacteria bacterium]|nr:VacJ family lipoprotein [Pseudomonadota bacterium]